MTRSVPACTQAVAAVGLWQASRAADEQRLKDAMAGQVAQLKSATAAIEAKRVLLKEASSVTAALSALARRRVAQPVSSTAPAPASGSP